MHAHASDILQSRLFGHIVRWTIVLALWTLLISMAIGRFGISNYMQLKENARILEEHNMLISIENQLTEEKIVQLTTNKSAQRHYLRTEFGLVSANETIVYTKPLQKHPPAPSQAQTRNEGQVAQNGSGSLSF